jgi:mutator protein MutT
VVHDAVVIVLRERGRVLVIRRGPAAARAGFWMPPGGKVEPGESQEEAVVREAREELGLRVLAQAKLWECATDDGAFALHWWSARRLGGEPTPHPGEVAELRWVTADEFLQLEPIFPAHRAFFRSVAFD